MKTYCRKYCVLLALLSGLIACSDGEEETEIPVKGKNGIRLTITGDGHIDSAQVFFFKKSTTTDTLIHTEIVHGISAQGNSFDFSIPAGYYNMVVWGNVETEAIRVSLPYSSSDIQIRYANGKPPPVIYYTGGFVTVGIDKSRLLGMVLVTSLVQLTIKNVPDDVNRITVDLFNTGVGVYMGNHYMEEMTTPHLASVIYDTHADSSYTVSFSCFPTVKKFGLSSLEVKCYHADGNLKYTGKSEPFTASSRKKMLISCSFQNSRSERKTDKINHFVENSFAIRPVAEENKINTKK